ncbi:hypothetical protein [Priestia aryabhattai]
MERDKNSNRKVQVSESLFEDKELSKMYGDHIEKAEKGQSETHHINKPEDVFNLL